MMTFWTVVWAAALGACISSLTLALMALILKGIGALIDAAERKS